MPNAYVNAGDIVLFDADVDMLFRDDVLASTLYFQLAASRKFSKSSAYSQWRDTYLEAMEVFGWVFKARGCHHQAPDCSKALHVWPLIKQTFGNELAITLADVADEAVVQAEAAFCAIQQNIAVDEGQVSAAAPRVALQVSCVVRTQVLHSVLVSFQTREPAGNYPLMQAFDPDMIVGDIDIQWLSCELSDLHYELYREAFNCALAQRRKTLTVVVGGLEP